MRKNKTKDPNIEPKGLSKRQEWVDAISANSMLYNPGKEDWRKRIIYSMFEWLNNPENIMIEDFFFDFKISMKTFDCWRYKYEDLQEAYTEVKRFLGARRRKGAIQGKYNYGAAYRDMHIYEPNWGPEVDKYHADLKNDDDKKNSGAKFVVVERYTPLEESV